MLCCADVLKTPITQIINYSHRETSFLNSFKSCFMLLSFSKKPSMGKNILQNYRPVSNLSFLSKLIEKDVAKQLNYFIGQEEIPNVHQSAYRSFYSTETALLNRGATEQSILDERGEFHENSIPILRVECLCIYHNL